MAEMNQQSFSDLVAAFMRERNDWVTSKEVAKKFKVKVGSINRTMGWLEKDGKVSVDFETKKIKTKYGLITKPVYGTYKYKLKASG